MNCVQCALKNFTMFGSGSSYHMNLITLDNGTNAKFILMPINEHGSSKISQSYANSEGKMKLNAYVCGHCGHIDFQRSY